MAVGDKHKMTDEEKAMYTGICICRNAEVNLRWLRSQMLIFINVAALSFLGTQAATPALYPYIGGGGIALCLFWWIINRKTQQWINYWHQRLSMIDPPETDLLEFRMFSGTEWKKINGFPSFHFLLGAMPIAFSVLWILIIVLYFFIEKKPEPAIRFLFEVFK